MKIGDKIQINLEGTINELSNSHGTCFKVQFPRRDFNHVRSLWVDEDEIVKDASNLNWLCTKLTGMKMQTAQLFLGEGEIQYRVISYNGVRRIITADLQFERINLIVEKDLIINAYTGYVE